MATYATIQIRVNESLYLRDPESSELGRRIVSSGILLLEQVGYEQFTFKKLAKEIHSTEASIYRYFLNKHKFLGYIVSWYHSWIEYQIDYQTHNIDDASEKLRIAINVVSENIEYDPQFSHIDEVVLHNVVIRESPKTLFTMEVEQDNASGYLNSLQSLCGKFAELISAVNPNYASPRTLSGIILSVALNHKFYAQHLPWLSELKVMDKGNSEVSRFIQGMIFKLIGK
ncbi:MAG: TetR/AcrR family transcriptional regulator [Cyclobacteriaceae bacterium]